jgi:hypothetical protein
MVGRSGAVMKKEEVFIDDGSQLRAMLRPSDIGSVVGWFLQINRTRLPL